MTPTPISLLDRLRDHPDEVSWRRLFDLYTPLIRHWLRRQGLAESDVDDLMQDVCATIAREIAKFDHVGRIGAFRSWIRNIVVNRARGFWRSRKNAPGRLRGGAADDSFGDGLDQLADPDSGLSRLWDREHDEFIARRLLELTRPEFSEPIWRAFERQVIGGLSAAQAAEELGTTVNAVLIAKSRVLRRLRQESHGLIDAVF